MYLGRVRHAQNMSQIELLFYHSGWLEYKQASEIAGPIRKKRLWLSLGTNIDSSGSVVGRALLLVENTDGQECPSYVGHRSMKF